MTLTQEMSAKLQQIIIKHYVRNQISNRRKLQLYKRRIEKWD